MSLSVMLSVLMVANENTLLLRENQILISLVFLASVNKFQET